jgi:hypothetical protein
MDSNTHSTSHPASTPAGLAALAADLQRLAAHDPDSLADGARAERVQGLGGLVDRLEGQWLAELADLALVCRTHHRAVHEGGWRLTRGPDGQLTATPPHRQHRRHPAAA